MIEPWLNFVGLLKMAERKEESWVGGGACAEERRYGAAGGDTSV